MSSQKVLIHGPQPITTQSVSTVPLSVSTASTAEPEDRNPVALTLLMMVTPSFSAFPARPIRDFVLLAYPPFFS